MMRVVTSACSRLLARMGITVEAGQHPLRANWTCSYGPAWAVLIAQHTSVPVTCRKVALLYFRDRPRARRTLEDVVAVHLAAVGDRDPLPLRPAMFPMFPQIAASTHPSCAHITPAVIAKGDLFLEVLNEHWEDEDEAPL